MEKKEGLFSHYNIMSGIEMKKLIHILLILCALVPLDVCVSCGNGSTVSGIGNTASAALNDDKMMFYLTEEFEWIKHRLREDETYDKLSSQYNIQFHSMFFERTGEGESPEYAKIPNMYGVVHRAKAGDTVSALVKKYYVPSEVIMDVNTITNDSIEEGKELYIPNPVILEKRIEAFSLPERFLRPVEGGITRPFGWQRDPSGNRLRFHAGIDVLTEAGAPVRAAMSGWVSGTGKNPTHGAYVILQHYYRYQTFYTFYSNLSDVSVTERSYVWQGAIIGETGDTSDGTYPHRGLHFGIYRDGNAINPETLICGYETENADDNIEFDERAEFIVQTIHNTAGSAVRIIGYTGSDSVVSFPDTINGLPVMEIGAKAFIENADDNFEFDDRVGLIIQTIFNDAGNTVRIIGYMGSDTNVRIPDSINGLPVTEIGAKAFYERGITAVTIPAGVTAIGDSAFLGNMLNRVTIPGSVAAIGDSAFMGNRLYHVTIPGSVATIGKWAFLQNKLKSVTISTGVTSIGTMAFLGNRLKSVTIPASVTDIGYMAFASNELKSVTISTGVAAIGEFAFSGNKLKSVTIPASVAVIENWAFERNKLKRVTIPVGITSIGRGAFAKNKLKRVTIPASVTSIGEMAFTENNITRITIGADVILIKVPYPEYPGVPEDSFSLQFDDFYTANGSKAGTNIYGNGSWNIKVKRR